VRTRLRGLAALVGALGCASCALPPARWDVPEGGAARFADAKRSCEQLTSPDAQRFDDCMSRRGFERESLWQRMGRGITGG
jgi:hypothetical protein